VIAGTYQIGFAERLVLSPGTIVSYLNLIYKKLDVSSRTAAMRYAIDHQLIDSGIDIAYSNQLDFIEHQ
jgi:DNA-binding NarL/FixJ family response regulator